MPTTLPPARPLPLRAQRWLQIAWLALVVPLTAIHLVGAVQSWLAPLDICVVVGPDCSEAAAIAALARVGLTPFSALIVAGVFYDFVIPLGCLLMGLFIFWRRSDRLVTLTIAAGLALYGLIINSSYPDELFWSLDLPALVTVLHLVFWGFFYYVLVTFPTGRFVPRWSWLLIVAGVGFSIGYQFLGPAGSSEPPFKVIILLIGLALQVYRYQREATPSERQQSRWVLLGLGGFVLNVMLYTIVVKPAVATGEAGVPYLVLFAPINALLVLSLPATLMIASLRYRLWDIDVIIRRTLIYSALTALLALIYFGSVIVFQTLFGLLTGERQSALVTVLSTLVIAALFGPLRVRLQRAIDRRFYRRKYDAVQTLAAFGARVRDELELDQVTAQLVDTAAVTLQPANASLWLRPPAPSERP